MIKVCILTANLGNFDIPVDPVEQEVECDFFRFTDDNFPPITGLTPRLQYRIPKLYGWEMKPGYDIYIWLDGSFSFGQPDSVEWFLNQLGNADMAVFAHPDRNTIKEEVDHIEDHLRKGKPYITSRYKNGLHQEMYEIIKSDPDYVDNLLFTSTAFIYRNNPLVRHMMREWWYYQSRYFTCDQVAMPYVIDKSLLEINIIPDNQYKIPYLTLVSKHK